MVARRLLYWSVAALAGLGAGAGTVGASPITFTGNVAADFSPTNPSVVIVPHSNIPVHIAQPQWMTDSGLVSGWNIKDLRLSYDPQTDTMYVGVNTFGIAGNVDGNGTPGVPDPRLTASGGTDPAHFGGDKGMAVGFAPLKGPFNAQTPPAPVIVAGVPGNKAQAGPGLDGFSVAHWTPQPLNGPNYDLVTSFGTPIAAGMGNLAFDPSAQHPGFEFTIANFSKLLGANPLNGFVVSAQDGSVDSIVTGKDYVFSTPITFPEAQQIPEPATVLIWSLGLGGLAAWRRCSRRRSLA
jgi:hypothetical protein